MDQEHSFDISGELYNRALNSLAGGVNSNVRLTETPHPLFYNKAKGSKIYDVDGNQYIDYVLGQGPMIFGHSPDFLLQAVTEASESGQLFAGQHLLELEAAEAVKTLVPNAELVRFASSGTEAVEAAFRLARAYTQRNVIIKFEGHYHGWSDGVLFNTAAPLRPLGDNMLPQPEPMSQGVADNSESGLIILPWNNFEAIKTVFEKRGDEIAAVITEPIMCNTNCIMPKPGYLEHLKESCDRNDSLLIFDEVITGFRVNSGGAQSFFGITPHLATFAKAAAGGFPVSILTGSKEIMSLIGAGTVMHGGTLNANVMSMAATKSSMEHLSDKEIQTNKKLNDLGQRLMKGLQDINSRLEAGMLIQGPGSVFAVSFTDGKEVFDYRSHVENSDPDRYAVFVSGMMKRGIRINSRGIWFLSESHTDMDIESTLSAASEVLQSMAL
ncbi:MAG: aspartate aminotransferase family protein [Dehalococcoidia bacterium]|nr:aspartate aminotransferase family protein [Dehalococcoidia bacterium]